MSNYILYDVAYLWVLAKTYFPWRSCHTTNMTRLLRRAYWKKIVKDGWFLGWPLWFGKRRGKG